MTKEELNQLGKTLWDIADQLRGCCFETMQKV